MLTDNKKNQATTNNRFYLPALDGLRFLAFAFIFVYHFLEKAPKSDMLSEFMGTKLWFGVDIFFVLSGFLITLILLLERSKKGRYSLKNFYFRRILRIWPLYYLALVAGFFIWPAVSQAFLHNGPAQINGVVLQQNLPMFAVFAGNWALIIFKNLSSVHLTHLWTISIEEQIYLFWPLALIFLKNFKSLLFFCLGIILLSFLTRLFLVYIQTTSMDIYFNTFSRVDTFMFGAILAALYHYKKELLIHKFRFGRGYFVAAAWLLFAVFLNFNDILGAKAGYHLALEYLLMALFCGYFTYSAIVDQSYFSKIISTPVFVWLGKISYGLYVWHRTTIDITERLLSQKTTVFAFIFSFVLTIIVSAISFYCFENIFLNLKKRFTFVQH